MSKFKTFCESILEEAKIDDAIKKFELSEDQAISAKSIAKSLSTKQAKFAEFICKNIDTKDLLELIKFFIDNSPRLEEKDINKYTTETLSIKMKELGKSKNQQKNETSADAPVVWESDDGNIVVRNILTWEASKKYGAGTAWCITMKDNPRYWNQYTEGDHHNFYFVYNKLLPETDALYKLAVVVTVHDDIQSIYNAPDQNILQEGLKELKKLNIPMDIFKGRDIKFILMDELKSCANGSPVTQNEDGSFDVNGNIYISCLLVKNGKLIVKFRNIKGNFEALNCDLTCCEGFPKAILGEGNGISVQNNKITSLVGMPKEMDGYFSCSNNLLTSLEGAPEKVGGCFYCHHNPTLTSIDGCPKEVGGSFELHDNGIKVTIEEIRKICKVGGTCYVK